MNFSALFSLRRKKTTTNNPPLLYNAHEAFKNDIETLSADYFSHAQLYWQETARSQSTPPHIKFQTLYSRKMTIIGVGFCISNWLGDCCKGVDKSAGVSRIWLVYRRPRLRSLPPLPFWTICSSQSFQKLSTLTSVTIVPTIAIISFIFIVMPEWLNIGIWWNIKHITDDF